jgi:hypothetical protein
MPSVQDPLDRNHVIPAGADAEKMWAMLRDDVPFDKNSTSKPSGKKTEEKVSADPAAPDGEIGVLVQNATRSDSLGVVNGRANTVSQALVQQGFARAASDTSGSYAEERTVVRYPSAELEGDAQRVAKSLGIPLSSVKRSADVSGRIRSSPSPRRATCRRTRTRSTATRTAVSAWTCTGRIAGSDQVAREARHCDDHQDSAI